MGFEASPFPVKTARRTGMPSGVASLPDPLPVPAPQDRHEVTGESELAEESPRLFREEIPEGSAAFRKAFPAGLCRPEGFVESEGGEPVLFASGNNPGRTAVSAIEDDIVFMEALFEGRQGKGRREGIEEFVAEGLFRAPRSPALFLFP